MKYEIDFNEASAREIIVEICTCFDRTEHYFKTGDLHRNIVNACAYSEAVRFLRTFCANVDASGIYDDNGFDRIGYRKINGHEFIKNGVLNFNELKEAVFEIASGK